MKHSITTRALGAVGLAVVLMTSACSDDAGPGTTASASELDAEDSPLLVYLGDIVKFDEASMIAEQTAIEEIVAQCMSDEGFEYTVPDVASQFSGMSDVTDDWNSKEWVSKNGYGMSGVEEESEATSEPELDPNSEYVDSLSESSRVAYEEALWGVYDMPEDLTEEEQMEWTQPLEDQGCYGAAQHESGSQDLYEDPAFLLIDDEVTALYEDILKDPKITALDTAWADCMADAGYPGFSTQTDARESIYTAQDEMWADLEETGDGSDAELDPGAEKELRELEIATALADLECKEEVDYDPTALEVQFAAEEQFIKDHKSELDALLAAHADKDA